MRQTRCVGCNALGRVTERPAPHPGPRCLQCWRDEKKRRAEVTHGQYVEKTYGITPREYQALYKSQGGKCAICQWATGKTKRLAVEHEHNKPGCDHPPEQGCWKCVRCLACDPCNQLLGRFRVESLTRAIDILTDPKARKILAAMRSSTADNEGT